MRVRTLASRTTMLVTAVLVAAGCGGSTTGGGERAATPDEASTAEQGASREEVPATFDVTVVDGVVKGGPQQFRVRRGDRVVITISSDAADEAHLHGIDTSATIPAGGTGRLEFTAEDQGSYELELHESGLVLGAVAVL